MCVCVCVYVCDYVVFLVLVSCRYATDLVVCSALGVDMYDCVFPTRTAVSGLLIHMFVSRYLCSLLGINHSHIGLAW